MGCRMNKGSLRRIPVVYVTAILLGAGCPAIKARHAPDTAPAQSSPSLSGGRTNASAVSPKARVFYRQASNEFKRKRYPEAIELTDRAIEISPSFYDAYILQCECYVALQKHEDAIRVAKVAAKINSDRTEAYQW